MRWKIISVAGWICAISFVSGDKSQIISKATRETWISMENFKTLLEVSLNGTQCTNVFISGRSLGAENIFIEFVKIYPYEYTLNSRTYDCDGYFGISSSTDELVETILKVPTTISTTELLIIVDDEIDESSKLINVSMYGIANVNVVARNNLWTLSENYMSPRVFKKVSRHDRMVHTRGIANLQGREINAAAFYNPPLCYLRTAVNRTVDGIEGEFFIANDTRGPNGAELDGIELRLFLLIAERLNFTWTIRKPNNCYRYGRRNGTGWNGGMVGQIFRKEVDIAFTGIWVKLDHYEFTNLTKPWTIFYIHFLVPRPKPYTSFWALTRPLSPKVWLAVFVTLAAQTIYVYTRARIDPRVAQRFRSFVITWTELIARLVGTGAPREMQGFELQFQLWHLIGVLMVTAYCSSLAARLASSGFERRIDTTRDFIEANLTWGREGPIPLFESYFDDTDPYARRFPERFEHENDPAERHLKIVKGNYAIVGKLIDGTFFPENDISPDDLRGFRVMKAATAQFYTSFACQSWLFKPVDMIMLGLQETGLVAYHMHDVLHRRTGSALREVQVEKDGFANCPRVLALTPLGGGFLMLLVGLLAASIVFYFELRSAGGNKPIRQVLAEIKGKRDSRNFTELRRKRQLSMLLNVQRKDCAFALISKKPTVISALKSPRPCEQ